MKKIVILLCILMLLLTACAGRSIVGSWETEHDTSDLGFNLSGDFISTITRVTFTEKGIGAWEIEFVESREILRREFTYTLDGDTLKLSYVDGTGQEYHVDFEDGILLLTGTENLALKPMEN